MIYAKSWRLEVGTIKTQNLMIVDPSILAWFWSYSFSNTKSIITCNTTNNEAMVLILINRYITLENAQIFTSVEKRTQSVWNAK